jgi:ABC-type bacteriocin/lantibiotic exporter with double-glycine peptidase domain
MTEMLQQTESEHQSSAEVLRILEQFALSAQVPFDRVLATRVLSEAERAIEGDDAASWGRRLVAVGASLELRIRTVEGTFGDILTLAQQGIPTATRLKLTDGRTSWLLIAEVRGRRARLVPLTGDSAPEWHSLRSVRKQVTGGRDAEPVLWVIGQAAFSCAAASNVNRDDAAHGAHAAHAAHRHSHMTPLTRLLGMVVQERRDIWVLIVFSLVVGILALASPIAVEALVNTVAFGRYVQPVIVLAAILFTFLAFAAGIRGLITYIVELVQRRLFVRTVEDLAYRLPRVQQSVWDAEYGPELTNRFFDIVTVQKAVATILLDGIAIVLQTAIGMTVIAFYHPALLGFDLVLLLCLGLVVFGLGRGAVGSAIRESRAKYALAAWLQDLTRNPTAFKLHGGNQLALDRADQLAIDWLNARRVHFRVVMRQILFALGLQALAATALLGIGGWLVIRGELGLGQLVAAELIVMMIVGSFAKIGKHLESFFDLLASMDKLGHLFDLPTEPQDKLIHLTETKPAVVSVRGVSYEYPQGGQALGNIELNLSSGGKVAVTGPAGAGKSTLLDLLAGLRTPSEGHIELDGLDLRELRPDSLREHLALARGIEIFPGSIDENVHLNRRQVSSREVREALDAVGLLDEATRLPEGLGTPLQVGGAPLTHSQCLRLMLARAIAGRPRLLLVDGTLDSIPESALAKTLQRLTSEDAPWTLLVATNRHEMLKSFPQVITLPQDAWQKTSETG